MKKKVNYFAVIMAIIIVISVFLPWAEASSSVSFGGYNQSYHSGGVSGFLCGAGIIGVLIGIIGLIMALNCFRWTFVMGIFNFLIGIGFAFGWFSAGGSVSYNSGFGNGNASAHVDPQIGVFLFIFASLIFIFTSLTYLKRNIIILKKDDSRKENIILCSNCGKKYLLSSKDDYCDECGKKL
jgi:hypothetical protein